VSDPLVHAKLLKRQYPAMTFLWEAVPCRYCNMPAGIPCVTRSGASTSYPHSDRVDDFQREMAL
jgi:hypothetical protein